MAPKIEAPKLMIILDRQVAGSDQLWLSRLVTLWPKLPEDGSVWVQLRCKSLGALPRRQLLEQARTVVGRRSVPVVVNGEAAPRGFDGVHWPEATVRALHAKPDAGAASATYRSAAVHDGNEAARATEVGAQVLVFAPVFSPGSKRAKPRGLPALRFLCAKASRPVIALGGITPERVQPCLDAGAHGVGILSAFSHPDADPIARLAAYMGVLHP